MKTWALFMGAILWYVFASAGNQTLAIIALTASAVYALLPEPKPEGTKEKSPEPIVIESKRSAPYRIPKKVKFSYSEKDSIETDWADDAVGGLASIFGAGVKVFKKIVKDK